MPEVLATLPRGGFEIRCIPVEIEDGAPGGYASGGSLDGARPGVYYINLKDTADWPRWTAAAAEPENRGGREIERNCAAPVQACA